MKNRILSLVFMLATCWSWAQSTDAQLTTQANVIRNETVPAANTKGRIADMFQALINSKQGIIGVVTASGTNTYTAAVNSAVTSYINGQYFLVKFTNGNTGAATLNINALGSKVIKKSVSTDLESGDIAAGQIFVLAYDGTNFQIIGGSGSGGGGGSAAWGDITGTLSAQTDLQAALDAKQPIDADLTAIAGLTPTNDDVIQRKAGAWTNRSIAQLKTDLGLVNSVSGTTDRITVTGTTDPVVDIAATYAGQSSINTLGTITTGTWNGNDIGFSNIAQGSALSVLGVMGNSVADNASIVAGTDGFVLRRSGTTLNFGTIGDASIADVAWGKISGEPTTLAGYGITDAANKYLTANRRTADYTLVLTDADTKLVEMNVATANNLTIPANSSVAFPVGTMIPITQYGAGQTSIVAAGGVTIRSSSGVLTSPGQYSPMIVEKIATDEWYLWNGTPPLTASNGITFTSNNFKLGGTMTENTTFTGTFNFGIGISPTARLHIDAGTTAASTAPLKLTSGPLMTTAEAGGIEFLTDKPYFTITTGAARKEFALADIALTSGRVPFATTNGRLTDDSDFTFSGGNTLNVTQLNVGAGTAITQYISNTATLDFPSTAAETCEVLTITLTGAALGDIVMLGVPNGSVPDPEGTFPTAWVSATNTVTVKFCNLQSTGALDPASGTFKVSIIK